MKKQVKVSNKKDFALIIDLMLKSGVPFSQWRKVGETVESYVNEVYINYPHPIIGGDTVNCASSPNYYPVLIWPDDAVEIINELFPQEGGITLDGVGDYIATITDKGITIHTELITFDKFAEVEDNLQKYLDKPYGRTVIRTKSKEDHLTLVELAVKAGKTISDGYTPQGYVDRYHERYPHMLINNSNEVTSCIDGYDRTDKVELSWPEDASKAIDTIFNYNSYDVEDVGSYTATFHKDGVHVGCQHIKLDKFAELSALVKKFKGE